MLCSLVTWLDFFEAEMGTTGYRHENCFSNKAVHKEMKDNDDVQEPPPLFHLRIHVSTPNELNGRAEQITGVELHPSLTEVAAILTSHLIQ